MVMDEQPCGIGITYLPQLDPLLKDHPKIIDILEIEPQTHWYYIKSNDSYAIDKDVIENICSYIYPKIIHSVGSPIGTINGPDPIQIQFLLKMISLLKAHWISEHLSFNRVKHNNKDFKTGFLLPPLHNFSGINASIKSINIMSKEVPIPFCIENGVNYLKPRKDELSEGQFISEIIEKTGCGLVLDLHNAYTNELNGRQSVKEFLNTIPLRYVRELHLAGGSEENGYWLDSHSGIMPKQILDQAYDLIPNLINLQAIVFEIEPSHLSVIGLEVVYEELKKLHKLWEYRCSQNNVIKKQTYKSIIANTIVNKKTNDITTDQWEYTLGSLVIGKKLHSSLAKDLLRDEGLKVIQKIITSFRSSMIIRGLKLTSRLLILTLGMNEFKVLLSEYWKVATPEIFTNSECIGFAKFLKKRKMTIQFLYDILKFELTNIHTKTFGTTRRIRFRYDLLPIIQDLMEYKIPRCSVSADTTEIEISSEILKI
jgi:uncharacterized protein (UPF0276 family)